MGECECAAGDIDVLAREATALEQLDLSWCDLAGDESVQVGVSSLPGMSCTRFPYVQGGRRFL